VTTNSEPKPRVQAKALVETELEFSRDVDPELEVARQRADVALAADRETGVLFAPPTPPPPTVLWTRPYHVRPKRLRKMPDIVVDLAPRIIPRNWKADSTRRAKAARGQRVDPQQRNYENW